MWGLTTRTSRRTLAGVVVIVFLTGDVAAASRGWAAGPPPPDASERLVPREAPPVRLAQNPCAERQRQPQPTNPCDARRRPPREPSTPGSVGRDKVDQMLRERMREGQQESMPSVQSPSDTGDDAIRRLGEHLRQQAPGTDPALAVAQSRGGEPG